MPRLAALLSCACFLSSTPALANELLLRGANKPGPRIAFQDLSGHGLPAANVQQVSFAVCQALERAHKRRAVLCRFALTQLARTQPKVLDFFGCQNKSCFKKAAAHIDARWVVHGKLSMVGGKRPVQLELVVLDVKRGRVKKRVIERARHAGAILKRVEPAVRKLRF